jgi:hypothetical protein
MQWKSFYLYVWDTESLSIFIYLYRRLDPLLLFGRIDLPPSVWMDRSLYLYGWTESISVFVRMEALIYKEGWKPWKYGDASFCI